MIMKSRSIDNTNTIIHTTAADYPKDWQRIFLLWSKFGGKRVTKYKFLIYASLTDCEKVF